MRNRHRRDVHISDAKALARRNRVSAAFGLARARERPDGIVEDVGEALRESGHRVGRPVHPDRNIAAVGEGADIVYPVDVIGVIVREQNGVHLADARGNELEAQLGRSVNEYGRAPIRLHDRANAGALISGIRRPADFARASDLRDAKAGSCPQEGEFQTVSTLSRLVVPGMSKGTPAVTMMRSPFDASSLRTTTFLVWCIIAS